MATITWKNATSDLWGTASAWTGNVVPGGTDDVVFSLPGSYFATIAEVDTRTIRNLHISAGAVTLLGALTLNGSATIDATGMLDGGSTINTHGVIGGSSPGSTLLNNGVLYADTTDGTLQIDTPVFTSNGLAGAANGAILFITANNFTNLASNVLTGGTWEVDGNSAIDFAPGPFDFNANDFPNSTVADNEATIILNGPGSSIFGYNPNIDSYDDLETSLLVNGLAGTLDILAGRDFTSANTLTNRGVIALGGGTLTAAALPNQAGAVIVGYGTIATAVANAGTIEAQTGTLTLAAGATGNGTLQVDQGATLRLAGDYNQSIASAGTIAVAAGTLRLNQPGGAASDFFIGAGATLDLPSGGVGTARFNGAGASLSYGPGNFIGPIEGFGAGETIALAGTIANAALVRGHNLDLFFGATPVGSITLGGDYQGASFTATPDGLGGTRITASGINPRNFAFEGPVWASQTITWSLATFSYADSFNTSHPFSHAIDAGLQAADVAVIQQAFDRWQGITGLTFTQVTDNSDPALAADIRLGWGDLNPTAGGEIGQAAYQFIGANFIPGAIVRLQDPAITPLVAQPGVIGGLGYSGFASTLYQIAVHEIGHALGLDHSADDGAVMFPTAEGPQNQDLNDSDIAAIQALYGTIALAPGQVSVAGFAGDKATITFADTIQSSAAAFAANYISSGVDAHRRQVSTFTNGGTVDALTALSGLVMMHAGGAVTLPAGYNAFATDAGAPVTVIGGSTAGQTILTGSGGLAFNAGAGAGSVFAAGGHNLISVYPGAGDQYIQAGAGDDTVIVLGANDTVDAGTGANQILTGAGNDLIYSNGADLIAAGGIGSATIIAGSNSPVAFFGPGSTTFQAGTGQATVVSTVGVSTINSAGGSQIWLGANQDRVNSTGADTIIGDSGSATVIAAQGNSFVFAGSGTLDFTAGTGSPTVLGSNGAATLRGQGGNLTALSYSSTRFIGGTGAATIAAFGGSVTVQAGSGAGVYLGGPGGANSIAGGSGQSIILGGGNNDTLRAGSGAGDVLQAGSGATTIDASGTNGAHKIYGGAGNDLILTGTGSTNILAGSGAATIQPGSGIDLIAIANGTHPTIRIEGFNPASDFLTFVGFPGGEKTTALAGAQVSGGSEILTLSDGTVITLANFTGLTAGNIL